MSMTYEVQIFTLCNGWQNTWLVGDKLQTFSTLKEAKIELRNFFLDIAAEIAAGERQPDEGFASDEFRIVQTEGK